MLITGLDTLAVRLDSTQQQQLLDYIKLLVKWNKVFNLTAVREPQRMISRHLLDSLTVLPFIKGESLLDLGSGAGLPGIPVAIACPALKCVLLDSNVKKTRFIQQAVAELGLSNVQVEHARVEETPIPPKDIVVSRAFSSPVDIIESAGHLCSIDGTMLFMLGRTEGLLKSLPDDYELTRLESVTVPFETGIRHIALCRHRRN